MFIFRTLIRSCPLGLIFTTPLIVDVLILVMIVITPWVLEAILFAFRLPVMKRLIMSWGLLLSSPN
jgi:hypothetical protein